MAERHLLKIQKLAVAREQKDRDFREAILAAHEAGESVRAIAPYAGLSPSRVHELLDETREQRD